MTKRKTVAIAIELLNDSKITTTLRYGKTSTSNFMFAERCKVCGKDHGDYEVEQKSDVTGFYITCPDTGIKLYGVYA